MYEYLVINSHCYAEWKTTNVDHNKFSATSRPKTVNRPNLIRNSNEPVYGNTNS